jgi:hypothetical protein
MRNGLAYRQVLWEPATKEIAGGLLPTPRANDAEKRGNFSPHNPRNGLPAAVRLLPTPVAQTSQGGSKGLDGGSAARQMLAAAGFPRAVGAPTPLPTPTTRDYKDSGLNMNYQKAAEKGRLPGVVVMQCSTQNGGGTYLNPSFVEEMMGFPVGWTVLKP